MRKILSLVLVLSMVFASFGSAFAAPKDVEGTDYEDAVVRLMALEIISGYDNGEFQPEKTITRAEFAKIMVHAVGVGESAQYSQGQTKYSDVPANHWASGYINQASGMKIINGYGNGTFGPEDKVTYAQAVAMIVRALGYEPKAKYMGGYPNGYLAVAAEEDITKDVSFADTASATRGDVAKMVNESLDVNLMYQSTWGDTPEYKNDDDDKTLLKTKLNFYEVEGVVINVPNTKSSLKDDEIEVDITKGGSGNQTYKLLVDNVDYDALLGLEVTLWADDDDDDAQVVNLEIDTDEDNIKFDTIVKKDTDKDEVYLYVDDDAYDWADGAKIYVNFEEEKADKLPKDVYGYFVFDDDEDVTFANLFTFDEVKAGVVFDVDGDEYSYVDRDADDNETLDLSDYEDGIHIYNEKFQLIDTDDIDVNSAIYGWEDSDELYLIVKNKTVSGELERVKDDEVKVDGESYDISGDGVAFSEDKFDSFDGFTDKDSLDSINGEDVTVVLDLNDEVQLIFSDAEATSATKYAVVTYADFGSKVEAEVTIQNSEGKEEETSYDFEERKDAKTLRDLEYNENVAGGLEFAVMEFKLNKDGEIESDEDDLTIVKVTNEMLKNNDGPALWKEADENLIKVKEGSKETKYHIDEDTVFMTALDGDGELDPDTVSYKSVYESEFNAETDERVVVIGEAGRDADMIVFLDKEFEGVDDDVFFAVVTEDPGKNKDDDYDAELDVFEKGTDTYILANKKDFPSGAIVAFKMNTDDEAKLDEDYTVKHATNVEFDEDDNDFVEIGTKSYKVPSNVVVWILDEGDADEEGSRSDIDEYREFNYIINDSDEIVAVTLEDELDDDDDDSDEDEGKITYIASKAKYIRVDGEKYYINDDTVLYEEDGGELAEGNDEIEDYIEKGMKVEIMETDGNIIEEFKLLETTVDKDALEEAIEAAEKVENDGYTDATWKDFQDALDAAKDVMDDPEATEKQVKDAKDDLKDAYDALDTPVGDGEITATFGKGALDLPTIDVDTTVEGAVDFEVFKGETRKCNPTEIGTETALFGVKTGDTLKVNVLNEDGDVLATENVEVK